MKPFYYSFFRSVVFFFLFLFLFLPILYITYKYHNPSLAFTDYFFYYPLYKDFDISSTESPFNMRLLSSFLTFILNKTGLYYHTRISFEYPGYDQSVFFCAVFTNWISLVVGASIIVNYIIKKFHFSAINSFFISFMFLYSFGNILYCMNGNTDGFSVLWVLILFILYDRKKYLLFIFYILTIFQREVALVFFFLLSCYDYWLSHGKERFYLYSILTSFFCITIYYVLRKTIFFTPLFSFQTDIGGGFENLFEPNIKYKELITQVIIPQTFYFPTFLILLYNCLVRKDDSARHDLFFIFFAVIIFFVFGKMTLLNNNMGRMYHMISTVILLRFLMPGLKSYLAEKNFL